MDDLQIETLDIFSSKKMPTASMPEEFGLQLMMGGRDVTNLLISVSWSGDVNRIARTLEFSLVFSLQDPNLESVRPVIGEKTVLSVMGGETLFSGLIYKVGMKASSGKVDVTCFDVGHLFSRNKVLKHFKGSPSEIARQVSAEIGVSTGELAEGEGTDITVTSLGEKSAFEILKEAYAAQSNYRYCFVIDEDRLNVFRIGNCAGGAQVVPEPLSGETNLIDADFRNDASALVNKVYVIDDKGNEKNVIEEDSPVKHSFIVYHKESSAGENAVKAESALKSMVSSVSVDALGDIRYVSGKTVSVMEQTTGLNGNFSVISDKHTFAQGSHKMSLALLKI